jgi:hypothetical protein
MTTAHHDATEPLAFSLRRRLTVGAVVGYLVFLTGTLLVIWLAWTHRSQKENPSLVLLIVWVVAATTHRLVRRFWRACRISAVASVLVYIVLVLFMNAVTEYVVSGMILVGLFGYVLSMVMGIPVAIYRRTRDGRESEPSVDDHRGSEHGR